MSNDTAESDRIFCLYWLQVYLWTSRVWSFQRIMFLQVVFAVVILVMRVRRWIRMKLAVFYIALNSNCLPSLQNFSHSFSILIFFSNEIFNPAKFPNTRFNNSVLSEIGKSKLSNILKQISTNLFLEVYFKYFIPSLNLYIQLSCINPPSLFMLKKFIISIFHCR